MKEIFANIWDSDVDVICVTTNGTVIDGRNIMGGGIALEAVKRWKNYIHSKPDRYEKQPLELILGQSILKHGHTLRALPYMGKIILSFPTKRYIEMNSDLITITISFNQLKTFSNIFPELVIGLPRPGCNLGGLNWDLQVKPLLESLWEDKYEDRIIIYHYQQEGVIK